MTRFHCESSWLVPWQGEMGLTAESLGCDSLRKTCQALIWRDLLKSRVSAAGAVHSSFPAIRKVDIIAIFIQFLIEIKEPDQFQSRLTFVIVFWIVIEMTDFSISLTFIFKLYKNANIANFVYHGKTRLRSGKILLSENLKIKKRNSSWRRWLFISHTCSIRTDRKRKLITSRSNWPCSLVTYCSCSAAIFDAWPVITSTQ